MRLTKWDVLFERGQDSSGVLKDFRFLLKQPDVLTALSSHGSPNRLMKFRWETLEILNRSGTVFDA